jgi:N utilization substance protein B
MSDGQSAPGARSAARLAAVQALYQMSLTGVSADGVIGEFVEHRFGREFDGLVYEGADRTFFEDLVRGVTVRDAEITQHVQQALSKDRALDRLEKILAAVLRAGAYELLTRIDVPARVVISEYVDVAHAFFEGPQPGFVNGVLDKLARDVRGSEMAGQTQKGAA